MKILKINLINWSFVFLALTTQAIKSEMALDESFGANGFVRTARAHYPTSLIQSNEKLIVAYFDGRRFEIVRYHRDGSLDATFAHHPTGERIVRSLVAQQNNQFIMVGETTNSRPLFYRYNVDGSNDSFFNPRLYSSAPDFSDSIFSIALQPNNGKTIIAGRELTAPGLPECYNLIRYNPDGSLDRPFQHTGQNFNLLIPQSDDKIIAIGSHILVRYTTDGSLDRPFGTNGHIKLPARCTSAVLQHNNKIITVGTIDFNCYFIACYNPDGTPDITFGPRRNGRLIVNQIGASFPQVAIQPNGKILILLNSVMTCYNPDGTPDITFGPNNTNEITLPHNIKASYFLFDSDTQTVTIGGSEGAPDTMQSILLRYRTLTPVEIEERRVAALEALRLEAETRRLALFAQEEAARIEAEVRDLMDIGLERKQCGICLEEAAIQNLIETECRHLFHPDCMTDWRNSGQAAAQTCPMCRAALPPHNGGNQ